MEVSFNIHTLLLILVAYLRKQVTHFMVRCKMPGVSWAGHSVTREASYFLSINPCSSIPLHYMPCDPNPCHARAVTQKQRGTVEEQLLIKSWDTFLVIESSADT